MNAHQYWVKPKGDGVPYPVTAYSAEQAANMIAKDCADGAVVWVWTGYEYEHGLPPAEYDVSGGRVL